MEFVLGILLVIFALLVVGLIVWLIYEAIMAIYRKTLRYETFSTNAMVCKKEYQDSYTTIIMAGKVPVPQHHDEEYNVYLMYEGEEHCFDDEDLYEEVNVGDAVRVLVHNGYNKHNEVKHVYLSLED